MPVELIGHSSRFKAVIHALTLLAQQDCPVWLTGEPGVGKKTLGQWLHQLSPRKSQPLVVFESALTHNDPQHLALEAAAQDAHTGTLLVADALHLTPQSQALLQRLLQSSPPSRIVVTSQVPAEQPPWAQLTVLYDNRISIPALRERQDDISRLTDHFLNQCAHTLEIAPKQLDNKAREVLNHYAWPGNLRQLKSVCRWLTLMVMAETVSAQDLPAEILAGNQAQAEQWVASLSVWAQQKLEAQEPNLFINALSLCEHSLIKAALQQTQGRRQEAAKLLGIGRNTLTRKLHEFSAPTKPNKE